MKRCVVAFSGGLDTSFLVPYVKDRYGFDEVITCTINTGGFSPAELEAIAARSKQCGANQHQAIDGTKQFYDSIVKYLVYGNVSRDGYPLCVGAERLTQGTLVVEYAKKVGAHAVVHGSTGAGNDQYRFDLVVHVLGDGLECLAPIRENGISRETSTEYLTKRGIPVSMKNSQYSYNVGLWGVSIGGAETHRSDGLIPASAWYKADELSLRSLQVCLNFKNGEIESATVDGRSVTGGIASIQALNEIGYSLGIGQHYHIGTSIPGKKGRLAYQSPAADIIYEAHRTLEKHVLSQKQIQMKRVIADEFGRLVHEAHFFDPLLDDVKAFLTSSQANVTGEATVYLEPYRIVGVGIRSRFDLLMAKGAVYGEVSSAYSGRDAEGASKLHGFEQKLIYGIAS